jgi:ribonuclease III
MTTIPDDVVEELPYNPKNVLIEKEDVQRLLATFGIERKVHNIDIYRKAFVHKSYCTRKNENAVNGNEKCPPDCLPLQEESNERLEFLGDAILNIVVANYLFDRYSGENEGFLTKMRTKLVNGQMLAVLSKRIGLQKYVIISQQVEANDGRHNKNMLEDIFEAFIAAIFLDFNETRIKTKSMPDFSGVGFQIAEKWIIGVYEGMLDFAELIRSNQNYKDMLIKFCQYTYQFVPRFLEMDVSIINNRKIFTVCIQNDKGANIGVGKDETKKKAEQMAAFKALCYYGQVDSRAMD